jgi:ATP-binding cassette subfamily B (MDR/TAP) protein 1
VRELQMACSQPFGFFVEVMAAALAAIGISFYYSWNLTLVILACTSITAIALCIITRTLQPAIERQKRDLNVASRCSHTAIKAVDIVKIFNAQDHEVRQYSCAIKKAAESYMIQAYTNSMQMGVIRFTTTAAFMVAFWYGTYLVAHGLSAGTILTTFCSCLVATQAAEQLLPQWLVLARGMSAGQALTEICRQMRRARRMTKISRALKPRKCYGSIDVVNVGACITFPLSESY